MYFSHEICISAMKLMKLLYFSHEINEIIVKVVNDAFNINTKLAEEMQEKVVRAGFSDTKEEEMLYKITNRLSEMSRVLHFKINSEQRELSRSITPPIQVSWIDSHTLDTISNATCFKFKCFSSDVSYRAYLSYVKACGYIVSIY